MTLDHGQHGWTEDDLDTATSHDITPDGMEPLPLVDLGAPAAPSYLAALDQGSDQPVPRITIHASCDRGEMARAVSIAAQDRRLSKAMISVELGGLEGAITRLAGQRSPDLLIIDTVASPTTLLRTLDRLADVVEPTTKVVVIGAANDIMLYRDLMARGVSEYLVGPVDPLVLAKTVCKLYVDPEKPFAGRVVSVIGAKGGCGASTLAHNLAWTLSERVGANTTLVDLDVSFGTVSLDFNQETTQTVVEALNSPDRVDSVFLDRLLTRQTDRLLLFPSPASIDRDFDFSPDAFEVLIDTVRRTAPFTVLDLPHLWTPWVRDCLVASDSIVIVATPELASLRNAKNMIDRLAKARINDTPPQVVLNMTGVLRRPEIPAKDFAEAVGVPIAAVLPFEPAIFGQAANNGQMLAEVAPGAKSVVALDEIASVVSGRPQAVKKKSSLLDQFSFLKR